MSSVEDMANAINTALPDVKRGSLAVFGDIFGGRVDNVHRVVSAQFTEAPSLLTVTFNETETLEVWNPASLEVGPDVFLIESASKVRWEWFYYGRPQLPENRRFIEHITMGEDVRARSDADWRPLSFSPSLSKPAVEILGW